MTLAETLFLLIRSGISDSVVDIKSIDGLDAQRLHSLFNASDAHDLAHIIGAALNNAGVLTEDEISEKFIKTRAVSVYRYEKQKRELDKICEVLNRAQIEYILLKGAHLRTLYKHAWMRTSCDIDILVQKDDLEKAAGIIEKELSYSIAKKPGYHDISLYSENGVHLELHFNINEDNEMLDPVLSRVWDYATPIKDGEYQYVLSNEFLKFHIVAHMAYHFMAGGCGIRPLIDLWLINTKMQVDEEIFNNLLNDAGLAEFYTQAAKLCRVWFEGQEHTDVTQQMERYILKAGVYGTTENKMALKKAEENKTKYIFNRIFMPYEQLKTYYKALEKYPFLYPFYQVVRWCRVIFRERKHLKQELVYINDENSEKGEKIKKMCIELGLK